MLNPAVQSTGGFAFLPLTRHSFMSPSSYLVVQSSQTDDDNLNVDVFLSGSKLQSSKIVAQNVTLRGNKRGTTEVVPDSEEDRLP
jgi:hypothetical protein